MAWSMVRIRVADTEAWKPVFDEFGAVRGEHGSKGGFVFTAADDPSAVTVLLEYPDADDVRRVFEDPRLREAMDRAGVQGPPEFSVLEEIDRPAR